MSVTRLFSGVSSFYNMCWNFVSKNSSAAFRTKLVFRFSNPQKHVVFIWQNDGRNPNLSVSTFGYLHFFCHCADLIIRLPSKPVGKTATSCDRRRWTAKKCELPLKVAQDSFQDFPKRRFWWVIINTLYQLLLQSWYQNTAQSLVNTLVLFSWHNRLL